MRSSRAGVRIILGLAALTPDVPVKCQIVKPDGSTVDFECNQTFSAEQIEWFKAGSALNIIRKEMGQIDILVNNAGMASAPGMPFTNNSEEDWDRTYAVNLKSVFLMCKALAPYFIERKAGRIINIASIAGPLAALTMPPYSVAKGGVITFTRVMAKELPPHGITVNAICPGYINTEMVQAVPKDVLEKNILPLIPIGRLGEPEDVAGAVRFLCSDEASFITGEVLLVDGGLGM